MSNLFKATVYVAVINLFGLALNFLLNLVLAAKFGVGREMDCYLTAIAVPSYIITILTGSLSVTFIPAFIDKKNSERKWSLMGSVLLLSALVGAFLSILIFIFSVPLIEYQSPGFPMDMKEYSSFLLRCYIILLLLTIINEVFSGIFYSSGEFVVPMMNKIISPVITISIIYAVGSKADAVTIVLSNVAGVVVQTAILLFSFFRRGHRLQVTGELFNEEVRALLKLMMPLLIGSVFYKFLPVFDKYFLSKMAQGSISVINYSQKLFLATAQVLGAALSMQVLSHMSALVSESNHAELSKTLNMLVRLVLFVAIPVTGIFFFFSEEIIRLMYERGEFTATNTVAVGMTFKIYALAIPAVILGTVVSQGLYVLKDTWSPFYVGFAEVLLYMVLCQVLVGVIGINALPTAYVTYFYFSLIILGIILSRKIEFIRWTELTLVSFKFIALIGLETLILHFLLKEYLVSGLEAVMLIVVSFLFYFVASYLLKYNEARFIFNKLTYETNKIVGLFQKKRNP